MFLMSNHLKQDFRLKKQENYVSLRALPYVIRNSTN